MHRTILVSAAFVVAITTTTATTLACPSCPTGQTAREQVVERDFGSNLGYAAAPFLVIACFARWIERRGAR